MASFASAQDDPNRTLWLATRAGKMEPSWPLGTTRCIPQAKLPRKPYNKSFIDQVCSVMIAGVLASFFFCEIMDLDFVSVHKHAKKELGQYPAILTSHLVSNPYILLNYTNKINLYAFLQHQDTDKQAWWWTCIRKTTVERDLWQSERRSNSVI